MEEELMLLKRVRNHDEEAFETLLNNYHNMIYKIIYSHDLKAGDYLLDDEELFQEASLALYKAALTYEEGRGVLFSSYAYAVMMKTITGMIYRGKSKMNFMASLDSLPNVENYITLAVSDSAQEYVRENRFNECLERFIESLSLKDQKILNLRRNDYSYNEISKTMGVSTKYIDNHMQLIKRKLHRYLKELEQLEKTI